MSQPRVERRFLAAAQELVALADDAITRGSRQGFPGLRSIKVRLILDRLNEMAVEAERDGAEQAKAWLQRTGRE